VNRNDLVQMIESGQLRGMTSAMLDLSMKHIVRLAAVLAIIACATAAVLTLPKNVQYVRAEDRNGDGRPDEWRRYDQAGRLEQVSVDSNFDGRSDVEEYYDSEGVLIRRETDRNFNGQVDLIEEFDPTTHQHAESVVDVDYDGRADLLVLFRDDRPVFSKRAPEPAAPIADLGPFAQVAEVQPATNDPLVPLSDPFQSDITVRGLRSTIKVGTAGLAASGGLPCAPILAATFASSVDVTAAIGSHPLAGLLPPRAPRGPPFL
jgi:hypothetical protein